MFNLSKSDGYKNSERPAIAWHAFQNVGPAQPVRTYLVPNSSEPLDGFWHRTHIHLLGIISDTLQNRKVRLERVEGCDRILGSWAQRDNVNHAALISETRS